MEINKDKVVTMHYRLTNDEGVELDSSEGSDPLVFLHGHGAIIPGLESALVGKKKSDKLKVRVAAKEAYGEHDERLKIKVPMTSFANSDQVVLGAQFQADTEDGPSVVTIVGIEKDGVLIDGNHPLAGVDLNFDVQIVDVREATKDELSHGHAHGPGGHHHH
jgi:FKBP-type peptidyl-prolyl cis-trans isomerase SlyD